MPGGYARVQGGGGVLTGENAAGARGGRSWPELGKKGPSRLFQWLGGALVKWRCGTVPKASLRIPFYSRSEAVAVNGITLVLITAGQWQNGVFRWLGINVWVY